MTSKTQEEPKMNWITYCSMEDNKFVCRENNCILFGKCLLQKYQKAISQLQVENEKLKQNIYSEKDVKEALKEFINRQESCSDRMSPFIESKIGKDLKEIFGDRLL